MPNYSYLCSKCQESFDRFYKIADRNTPMDEDCPNCDSKGHITQYFTEPPKHIAGTENSGSSPQWLKDKYKEIKKVRAGTNMDHLV